MPDRLRVGVIGVGAVGGTLAAALSLSGRTPVLSLVARGRVLNRLRNEGLRVYERGREMVFRDFDLVEHVESMPDQDYVFICTKSFDNLVVARSLAQSGAIDSILIPFQNGIPRLNSFLEYGHRGRQLSAVVWAFSQVSDRGTIDIFGWPQVLVGNASWREQNELGSLFDGTPISLTIRETSILRDQWLKFCFVVAISTTTAIYRGPCVSVREEGEARRMFVSLVDELSHLARAGGIENARELAHYCENQLTQMPPEKIASMAADIWSGRPGELPGFLDELIEGHEDLPCLSAARLKLQALAGD